MKVERFINNPIIEPGMSASIGKNINGPSLIRVPNWLEKPLGRYYLYFAHHRGTFIRLAYADQLEGPWSIYEPGTLQLGDSYCDHHIASPDVHVDEKRHEIRMYYHGRLPEGSQGAKVSVSSDGTKVSQGTKVSVSSDGVNFTCYEPTLGWPYFRVFQWGGYYHALAGRGIFYRSRDGLTDFERTAVLFSRDMRHDALKLDGNTLYVFYTNVGDVPEHILLATVELRDDWMSWKETDAVTVVKPETDYEGVDLPLEPSVRSLATQRVRQLRDPAIYEEDGATYLLYSVAGESGIAIARLIF